MAKFKKGDRVMGFDKGKLSMRGWVKDPGKRLATTTVVCERDIGTSRYIPGIQYDFYYHELCLATELAELIYG